MVGFLGEAYLWVKALHILSVITWMAAMTYLPRLYVYHCQAEAGSDMSEALKVMERRLLRVVCNPAMLVAWATGVAIALDLDLWGEAWFQAKLGFLLGMQLIHAAYARWRRHFANDANRHGEGYYRAMNEVPTVLMIGIVIYAVVRPY